MAPPAPTLAATSAGKKQVPARGIGLTLRIFEALVQNSDSYIEALPSCYVPAISQHVTGRFMLQEWCPVVVEEESGSRRVLYLDPLDVRAFRLQVRQELRDVQDKRGRVLRRIKNIRQRLPKAHPRLAAERLEREIKDAEVHAQEPLVRPLPAGTSRLIVFVEASPRMVQLDLVCQHLASELPSAMEAAGTSMLSLIAVGSHQQSSDKKGKSNKTDATIEQDVPDLELSNALSPEGRRALADWLQRLSAAHPHAAASSQKAGASLGGPGEEKARSCGSSHFRLAEALKRGTMADALAGGGGTALLVACSPPTDVEACEGQLRRSKLVLQVVGVLGASPVDPEAAFEKLVLESSPGSRLHLWFGQPYWESFAHARRRQLDYMRAFNPQLIHDEEGSSLPESAKATGEVVSGEMLEIRLLERIMRECYVDEQRCEEELSCLNRVLDKTLVDPDEVKEAMKPIKEKHDDSFLRFAQLAFENAP
eukprot:gb/GFBE01035526.1/.p1 GENE.gb/GFBE01035526.1/~~gb/GFBE01035526.1/.p1  ORF type:complete len:480 (+),score=99.40 gb/GFBE01035526.1/:1-1440(+)